MDIDLLKSTPDDQIEMMLMTMHMDKPASDTIPGGGSFIDTAMMSFSCAAGGGGGGGSGSLPQHFNAQDHIPNSPTMLSPQTTISFSNNNNNNNNIPSTLLSSSFASYSNNNSIENASSFPASGTSSSSQKQTSMAAMREMIFRIAAMQPIYIDPEAVKPPKRRNVRISKDPQSVAARHRRERISERIRILQRLVPGGTKMDTASMLDEAIHYVKFLKTQVQSLERAAINRPPIPPASAGLGFPVAMSSSSGYFPVTSHKPNNYSLAVQPHMNASHHNVQQFSDA